MILVLYPLQFYYLQAYEVVQCRWNKNYEQNDAQSKFSVKSTDVINFSPYIDTIKINNTASNEKIMNNTHTLNINDKQFFIKFLSRCSEGKNNSCVHSKIPKVSFPKKKEKSNAGCQTTPLIDKLIVISHLLLAINSSANVIIYMLKVAVPLYRES